LLTINCYLYVQKYLINVTEIRHYSSEVILLIYCLKELVVMWLISVENVSGAADPRACRGACEFSRVMAFFSL